MRAKTYNQNIKKFKEYGKLFGIKISVIKAGRNCYDPTSRTIEIDKNEDREDIVNLILHEMGHHHDDSLHPNKTDSYDVRTAYLKMDLHDEEIRKLRKKLLKLAESIEDGAIKKIIMKLSQDETVILSRSEDMKLKEFRGNKRNWLKMNQRKILTHPYRYFSKECYLTAMQKEKVIEVENRAWEYGEKIAHMIGVKIAKSFYKLKTECIGTYYKYVLTIDPLYRF